MVKNTCKALLMMGLVAALLFGGFQAAEGKLVCLRQGTQCVSVHCGGDCVGGGGNSCACILKK